MSYLLHLCLILIIILYSAILFGQISIQDSLSDKRGGALHGKQKYKSALDTFKVVLSRLEAKEHRNKGEQELTARMYRNIGMCLIGIPDYKRAEENLNIAINKYQYILSDTSTVQYTSRFGVCFQHKARIKRDLGEFEKAITYTDKALRIFTDINKVHNQIRVGSIQARIYYQLGDFQTSENIAYENIQKYQYHNDKVKDVNLLSNLHTALANAQMEQEKYTQAINNHYKALEFTTNSIDSARTYNNLGIIYTKIQKYRIATSNFNQSLNIKKRIDESEYHFSYAPTFENFGDLKVAQKDFDAALNYYQLTLINLTNNFRKTDINTNPKTTDNYYIYNKPDLLRVLDLKAQAALKSGNTDLAYNTYKELDNWTTEFYKDLSTNESKLTWIARAHNTYGHAIKVALKKGNKEKAFQYAEKAHAVLLWQSLSQQAARNLLSEEDKEKMDDLTAKIRQADQQYRYEEIKIEALRTLEREQEALEKTFDEKYPEYEKRKYQPEATTVNDIQKKIIDHQTAFIEYYQTDETLYIFTITKNGLEVTQKNAKGLADDIADFVKNISNENMNIKNYHTLAHKLYQQLIPKSIPSSDKINRIVIVPDREIGTLPFAALATQDTSGKLSKNTAFLVKKYATNYLYSAGSYLQLQQQKANQEYCFAGIAPGDYEMEKWKDQPLNQAIKELESIKSLHWFWEREILTEEEATKAAFEKIIKDGYKTILISTHAAYGENGGEIAFRDSILTQDAIDMLEINTHRLILSACETGVGKQNQGEGILSLGWNFAYKGVPSITMTHWKVNSGTTKDIIVSYSENLNKGVSADQALRKAQLEYLRLDDNKIVYFQPHYWAGFFHTGNIN